MARISYPFPSIIHLRALTTLYIRKYGYVDIESIIRDRQQIEEVGNKLKIDKIIDENSDNLVRKILGYPMQKDSSMCEGIDQKKMEILAERVFKLYKENFKPYLNDNKNYLEIFEKIIFIIPPYLKHIDRKKYYRYLDPQTEKIQIDDYIARKLDEFIPDPNIHHYCMYYWNEKTKKVEASVFMLNLNIKTAIIKYYQPDGTKWLSKSVQKATIDYTPPSSTMYLNFISEDERMNYLRTNLCLSVHNSDFTNSKYIKGTYSTARQNADLPVAGILILKKFDSYHEAFHSAIALKPDKELDVEPQIYFELMGYRFMVDNPDSIESIDNFSTSQIYKIVSEIKGAYVFGFLEYHKQLALQDSIRKGICFIHENGKVTMRIHPEKQKEVYGYIINRIFFDPNIIRMSNFYTHAFDRNKFEYTLKIDKNEKDNSIVGLRGVYQGVHDYTPRGGEIFFIKKEYKTLMELENNILPNTFERHENYESSSDEFLLIQYLTNRNFDKENFIMYYPRFPYDRLQINISQNALTFKPPTTED